MLDSLCRNANRREEDVQSDCQNGTDNAHDVAILPRGQINRAGCRRIPLLLLAGLVQDHVEGNFKHEQNSHRVQVMYRFSVGRIGRLDDEECCIHNNVEDGDNLRRPVRHLLKKIAPIIVVRIGRPKNCIMEFRKVVMPFAYAMNGEIAMEITATTVPKRLAIFT